MRFYLATSLDNIEQYKEVKKQLEEMYHTCTYDWSVHGNVKDTDEETLRRVAIAELDGIRSSSCLIVLLMGGRGTHVEIGAALMKGIPVLLYGENKNWFKAHQDTCAFYHLGLVKHFTDLKDLYAWVQR